jgi:hypothetical protein
VCACGNNTLRAEITLLRVEIRLLRVEITLCVQKSIFAIKTLHHRKQQNAKHNMKKYYADLFFAFLDGGIYPHHPQGSTPVYTNQSLETNNQ